MINDYSEFYNSAKDNKGEVSEEVFTSRAKQLDEWIKCNPVDKDWYESIDGLTYYEALMYTDEEWEDGFNNQVSLIERIRL